MNRHEPGKTLTADDIEAQLKDPKSLLSKEYAAALTIYAAMHSREEKETMQQLFTALQQKEISYRESKAEAREAAEKIQTQQSQQLEEVYRKQLHEITTQSQLRHPEIVPAMTQLAFHLDEWRASTNALKEVQTQQQKVVADWKVTQDTFANNVIDTIVENLTFKDGTSVPTLLTAEDEANLRLAFTSAITPLQALEKNPHKREQIENEENEIIKKQYNLPEEITEEELNEIKSEMSEKELIQVKQDAVERTNTNNQATLLMMLKAIQILAHSMKNNLSEEQYHAINWPYPTKNIHKNIEALLLNNENIKDLKNEIQDSGNQYIANDVRIKKLNENKNEHLVGANNAMNAIYSTLSKDPNASAELAEVYDLKKNFPAAKPPEPAAPKPQ